MLKDIVPVSGTKTFVTTNSRLRRSQRCEHESIADSGSYVPIMLALLQSGLFVRAGHTTTIHNAAFNKDSFRIRLEMVRSNRCF